MAQMMKNEEDEKKNYRLKKRIIDFNTPDFE